MKEIMKELIYKLYFVYIWNISTLVFIFGCYKKWVSFPATKRPKITLAEKILREKTFYSLLVVDNIRIEGDLCSFSNYIIRHNFCAKLIIEKKNQLQYQITIKK
jgi:hypothetical protein